MSGGQEPTPPAAGNGQAPPTPLRNADPRSWPEYLDARNVAELFGCSRRTAQRYLSAGRCGAYFKMGREYYVRREVFRKALQDREVTPLRRR